MSIKYGLNNAHYSKITSNGSFASPARLPGAESLTLDDRAEFKLISAAGIQYPVGVKDAYKSGELNVVSLPLDFLINIFGYRQENGMLIEGAKVSNHFALLFESIDSSLLERFIFYDCIAFKPDFKRSTIGENIEIAGDKLKIVVCRPLARLLRGYEADYGASVLQGEQAFDTWFDEVHLT